MAIDNGARMDFIIVKDIGTIICNAQMRFFREKYFYKLILVSIGSVVFCSLRHPCFNHLDGTGT